MEQFLLIIILALLLALSIVVFLIRQIFRFSNPYAPVINGGGGNPSSGSGGGSGTVILIGLLLFGLAFLSIRYQQTTDPPDLLPGGEPPRERIPDKDELEPSLDPELPIPIPVEPISVHEVHGFIDRPVEEWEVDRYNQAPENALPVFYFAIQIRAFSDEWNAKREAESKSLTFQNLRLIYLNEPSPFKLVIGPFSTDERAREYQKRYEINGFIRFVDRR